MPLSLSIWDCCHGLRLLRELRAAFKQGPLQARARAQAQLQPQLTSKLFPVVVVVVAVVGIVIVAFFAFIACAEMREISQRASQAASLPLSKDYHFPLPQRWRMKGVGALLALALLMSCAL